jgi:hypothetical protein
MLEADTSRSTGHELQCVLAKLYSTEYMLSALRAVMMNSDNSSNLLHTRS